MNKGKIKKIILWIIVIAVAMVIFCFSAQNAEDSARTSGRFLKVVLGMFPGFHNMTVTKQNEVIASFMTAARKCAHFCIYGFFGFWLYFLARQYKPKFSVIIAVAAAFIYSVTDELHQALVSGRSCQFRDMCIDTVGAFAGVIVALLVRALWQKLRKRRARGK